MNNAYMVKQIVQHLVGHKIVQALTDKEGDSFGFLLDNGTEVFVDCDAEGNGPGHLAIEPKKVPSETL